MRRTLPLTLLMLTLLGSIAFADRDRRRDRRDDRNDRRDDRRGPVVRDHRDQRPVVRHRDDRRPVVHHRDRGPVVHHRHDRRPVSRNRVYVNNGRYVFHGGVTRSYARPVIRHRYYDVRVRPRIVVENYDPVPGYVWVAGRWQWNGYEWIWNSGHYEPDPRYRVWYDDGSYDY